MVAFVLPPDVATALAALVDGVGKPTPVDELHVTLAYLGLAAAVERDALLATVADFARAYGPLTGQINGFGRFRNGAESHPIFAIFDSPQLPTFREALVEHLLDAGFALGSEHGFVPHITLTYIEADAPTPDIVTPETALTFEALTVAHGGEFTDIKLGKRSSRMATLRELLSSFFGLSAETETDQTPQIERAVSLEAIYGMVWLMLDEANRMTDGEAGWLHDVYRDDYGNLFAVVNQGGKLYRAPLTVQQDQVTLGEWEHVVTEFAPVRSKIRTLRMANGETWWLSISCSAVLNRVGEIDSRALFQSFEENFVRLAAESVYPYRTVYHEGEGLAYGQCRFVAAEDDLLITAGMYDMTHPLAQAEVRALANNGQEYGESIGYMPLSAPERVEVARDVAADVYRSGQLVEISLLEERDAASFFTRPTVVKERAMRASTKDFVKKLFADAGMDEAAADEFVEGADATQRSITEQGLITRESADDVAEGRIEDAHIEDAHDDSAEAEVEVEIAVGVEDDGVEDDAMELREAAATLVEVEFDDVVREGIITDLLTSETFMRDIRREMNELVEQRVAGETAALLEQLQTANGEIAQLTEALQRAQTRIDGLETQETRRTEQLRQELAPNPFNVRVVVPRDRGAAEAGEDSADAPLTFADTAEQTVTAVFKAKKS